jgi:hypothetical protein
MRETLSNHYDTSEVHGEDVPAVLATLNSLLCLESGMPALPCKISRCDGFYTLSMSKFTEMIDMDKLYTLIREDPDPETLFGGVTKTHLVDWVGVNPSVVAVVARVHMKRSLAAATHQPHVGPGPQKRGRVALSEDERY